MLDVMERCEDWAVIVALVGSGQEIHDGEAGLPEWGRALASSKENWVVLASPEVLPPAESPPGGHLFSDSIPNHIALRLEHALHLEVSVRSPRAQRIADWVDLFLRHQASEARRLLSGIQGFSMVLTRDLEVARKWLRDRSRGERRCGLIASSGARRLRAYGIELSSAFRHGYPYEKWFLNDPRDVRSSFQLEVAASQFECQGLELDYTGLCWGGDLTIDPLGGWNYRRFRGARWERVKGGQERAYLLNRYRVLLTRAREGMVIWVPQGRPLDPTLNPDLFDATAELFHQCGVREL